jgi:hypothetical protein
VIGERTDITLAPSSQLPEACMCHIPSISVHDRSDLRACTWRRWASGSLCEAIFVFAAESFSSEREVRCASSTRRPSADGTDSEVFAMIEAWENDKRPPKAASEIRG